MDLDNFILSVKTLDPLDILLDAAALNTQELADTNRANLLKGELSTGERTNKYRADWYADYKTSLGSISVPHMDLNLEGNFHKGIKTEVNGKDITTDSNTKFFLQDKYGDEIFTVQEKQFSMIVGEDIWSVINKKLKG